MIDKRAVEALIERVRRDVDSGMLPAAQFAVALNGEIMVSEALGDCTTATRFHTYSAIKPAVSLTVMELAAEGLFDLAAPVGGILGSFGSAGKQDITVSQVLLHSGGFPNASLERHELLDRAERLAAYASWQTEWQPGACYEYHPLSAHWVLADIITEATGSHFADAVTQRMMEPAGCSRWLAIAEDQQSDVADVTGVGTAPSRAELAAVGLDEIPGAISEELLTVFNLPWLRALGVPGGGGIARAEEMALWYGAVMLNSDGLLRPEVRSDAMVVRQSHPDWTGTPANRSHAFVLAGDDGRAAMRGHGHGASAEAFGHGGAGGQIAWADPRRGLAFAYFTNGLDRNDLASARRRVALSTKALACARMNT